VHVAGTDGHIVSVRVPQTEALKVRDIVLKSAVNCVGTMRVEQLIKVAVVVVVVTVGQPFAVRYRINGILEPSSGSVRPASVESIYSLVLTIDC